MSNVILIFTKMNLLTVDYSMVGEESPVLRVHIEPAYRQVSSGERVELDCSAPGQPPPSLAWSRAGGVPLGLRVRLQCIFYYQSYLIDSFSNQIQLFSKGQYPILVRH
jgi:hypothetical protein